MSLMTATEARWTARQKRKALEANARRNAWDHLTREVTIAVEEGKTSLGLRLEKHRWPGSVLADCVKQLMDLDYTVETSDVPTDADLISITVTWGT